MSIRFFERIFIFIVMIMLTSPLIFSEKGNMHNNTINTDQKKKEYLFHGFAVDNAVSSYKGMAGFDSVINRFMRRWYIKGASVAIMKNEELIYTKGYGFA